MNNRRGREPAFPCDPNQFWDFTGKLNTEAAGLTVRDWLAGQAMAGLCAYSGTYGFQEGPDGIAERAYEVADAMLAKQEHDDA